MKLLTLTMATLLILPAMAQKSKTKADGNQPPVYHEGIVYSLPRTGIRVIVKATQTMFAPGPYAAYADQLLGIRDAKNQPQSFWEIEEVKFDTFAEPDPTQVYRAMGNTAGLIQLAPGGWITGINSLSSPEIKSLVNSSSFALKSPGTNLSFFNLSDSPYLSSADSTSRNRSARLTVEQKAAQAAARILKSRMSRYEIAAGMLDEYHPDGKAYEESLQELNRIEKEYLSLFVGKTNKESYTFSFDLVPQAKPQKSEVIFRFDENRGILQKTDMSGKPVTLDFEKDETLAVKLNSLSTSENPQAGESGIYYRQPGIAEIRLVRELTVIGSTRTTIAQFGSVAPMPEELLDGTYSIDFQPETGAIKNVTKKIK